MSLYASLAARGPSGFGYGSTAEQVTAGLDLSGRTALITGCNSGIGHEALRVLALRGAHVIGAARTLDKARAACASVAGRTTPVACELSDPASIRACAHTVGATHRLDVIVCNAGIMALPRLQQAHGIELQFFCNHIGHFMLVNALLPALGDGARIVVVASAAHRAAPPGGIAFDDLSGERGYRAWRAYGQSKMANILFAKELARRLAGSSRTANAVHPGSIRTALGRHMALPAPARWLVFDLGNALFFKSIPQGAATGCYAAVHPGAAALSGDYLVDCNVARPRADAEDPVLARRLWEVSERIVAGLP